MGAVALCAAASLAGADAELARLRAAVDVEELIAVGWDPVGRVFAPSPGHPVFGFRECVVNGCVGVSVTPPGLCDACRRRWRVHHPDLSREEFVAVARPRIEGRRKREVLCRVCCVPGFERPAYGPTGLCMQCYKSYRSSRWTYLGRSYRCQVRVRLIPKPGLPHMMVVETIGRGCAVSARSARREVKTSRAM